MRSATEKSKAEEGVPGEEGAGWILHRAVSGLIEKVTFKQRFVRGEVVSHEGFWVKNIPGRGTWNGQVKVLRWEIMEPSHLIFIYLFFTVQMTKS